jgi:hypothetical protein
MARQFNRVDTVAESIIEEVGGDRSAKVLFKGKIVGVNRTLQMGHVFGEVVIEGIESFQGKLKIPFKNENIAAIRIHPDGTETVSTNFGPVLRWIIGSDLGSLSLPQQFRILFVLSTRKMVRLSEHLNTDMGY